MPSRIGAFGVTDCPILFSASFCEPILNGARKHNSGGTAMQKASGTFRLPLAFISIVGASALAIFILPPVFAQQAAAPQSGTTAFDGRWQGEVSRCRSVSYSGMSLTVVIAGGHVSGDGTGPSGGHIEGAVAPDGNVSAKFNGNEIGNAKISGDEFSGVIPYQGPTLSCQLPFTLKRVGG